MCDLREFSEEDAKNLFDLLEVAIRESIRDSLFPEDAPEIGATQLGYSVQSGLIALVKPMYAVAASLEEIAKAIKAHTRVVKDLRFLPEEDDGHS